MSDQRLKLIAAMERTAFEPLRRMQQDAKTIGPVRGAFAQFNDVLTRTDRVERRHGKETTPVLRRELGGLQSVLRNTLPQVAEASLSMQAIARFAPSATVAAGFVLGAVVMTYQAMKMAASFSASMRELMFGARESGLSPAQLKQLELGAEQFGLTAEDMVKAATSFANSMVRLHRLDPAMLEAIRPAKQWTGELERLAMEGKIGGENWLALYRAMDNIKQQMPGIEGQVIAERLAGLFGLPKQVARLSGTQFLKLMDDMKAFGPDPFTLKLAVHEAEAFNAEVVKTKAMFDRWSVTLKDFFFVKPSTLILQGINPVISGQIFQRSTLPVVPTVPWVGKGLPSPRSGPLGSKAPGGGWVPFAKGGIVTRPTHALIGEAGPEAVVPLSRLAAMSGIPAQAMEEANRNGFDYEFETLRLLRRVSGAFAPGKRFPGVSWPVHSIAGDPDTLQRIIKKAKGRKLTAALARELKPVLSNRQYSSDLAPSSDMSEILSRLPTKKLERPLMGGTINVAPTPQQVSAPEHRSTWSEALAAADDDRGKIDIRNRRDGPHKVEGVGSLTFRVHGPPGMQVNTSSTGMFKTVDVARTVRMAG